MQDNAPWSGLKAISLSGLHTHAKRQQRKQRKRQRGTAEQDGSNEFTTAGDEGEPTHKRRRVLGFEGGEMKAEGDEEDRGANRKLVIPVPSRTSDGAGKTEPASASQGIMQTRESNQTADDSASDDAAAQSLAAAQAEAELLQDVNDASGDPSTSREIPSIPLQTATEPKREEESTRGGESGYRVDDGNDKASLRAKLFANKRLLGDKDGSRAKHRSAVPLLARQSGGSARGDTASFQEDVARRPEDIPVDSETFNKVPISEFGAAMLRGMGASEDDIHRAQEGPSSVQSQANRYRGTRSEHPGLGSDKRDEIIAHLSRESDESAAQRRSGRFSTFQRGTVVRLRAGAHAGAVAVVVQAEGVPGLNNIKVRLDQTRVITFRKDDAETVKQGTMSDQEQAKMEEIVAAEEKELKRLRRAATEERRKRDEAAARKLEEQERERRRGNTPRSLSREKERSDRVLSRQSAKESSKRPRRGWAHPGIRVRVVDDRWDGGRWYRCKGTVLDVTRPGRCTIRIDSDGRDNASRVLEDVSERRISTALPKPGGRVLLIGGTYRGREGVLQERDGRRSKATVQLDDDASMHSISYDDVAELVEG